MKLDSVTPEMYSRDRRVLNDLNAVIPRIRPNLTFYGAALTRHFESMGIFTLNSAQSILQSRDKLFSLQLLIKNGLEIPTTGFANSPIDTEELIELVTDLQILKAIAWFPMKYFSDPKSINISKSLPIDNSLKHCDLRH